MSRRRKSADTTPFDTLRLEGSLFVPELLERAAGGEAAFQKEADYAIPKGLKLHDEYGRAFRIATASWQAFAPQMVRADVAAATVTRAFVIDLLRQCLGYTDLTPLDAPVQLGDRGFPVTAQASGGRLPVIIAPHHLGVDDPDPRFAIHGSGLKKKSAHQLAQEFLNASPNCLWAIVTNGKILRLLRDADTLTRPNFLEFDLETILRDDQHRYPDFSALWRILHASRCSGGVSPSSSSPTDCIWEQWKSEGHAQGLRVRDGLRDGVTQALLILGRGFLTQPDNTGLRQRLHDGTLTTDAYFQQLLRLIYRSLFLFCAEERDLLHPPLDANQNATSQSEAPIQNPTSKIQHSSLAARQAYAQGYSLRRFRSRALRQSAHDPYGDLWQSLRIVFRGLAGGQPRLALPALGGLFSETQCPDLDSAAITNRDLLSAMRELRWFFDKKSGKRSAIDYRNMGPEELGSVYESLLELVPTLDLPGRVFGFAGITDAASSSGNARKTTGSYYTPDSLVQELIKSALDPVIAQKLANHPENPIAALLSITVCDPSCGSGHFLLAAARRLAEKLAELRAPDGAVRPDDYRHALREVASRCLYGVDINPMAVELCRVALWLETVDPGKPLGFLNHHIRHGNSLLGTTPDLIATGLPDETFTAIEGDDKPACAELKKRNKAERAGFGPLFAKEEDSIREKLRQAATAIEAMDDSQPAALQQKEAAFLTNETAPEYRHAKLLADLWCAAFVIKKCFKGGTSHPPVSESQPALPAPVEGQLIHTDDDLFGQPVSAAKATAKPKSAQKTENFKPGTASGITTGTLRDYVQGKTLPEDLESEVNQLAHQYRFFHWHLAFPQVFDQGGFDCILGNPPWDKINLRDDEFFQSTHPQISAAQTKAERKRLIEDLRTTDNKAYQAYTYAQRAHDSQSNFFRFSGAYPKTGASRINLYSVFAEVGLNRISPNGRLGMVIASGIATDDNNKLLFEALVLSRRLISLWDFENRNGIFPEVDNRYKFCLFCAGGEAVRLDHADLAFYLHDVTDLADDNRHFVLAPDDFTRINPTTRTCPIFREKKDAELAKLLYSRARPLCLHEVTKDWPGLPKTAFNMANDSGLFSTLDGLAATGAIRDGSTFIGVQEIHLPLYEAKMMWHYDHRWASFKSQESNDVALLQKVDPTFCALPRYWLTKSIVDERFSDWKRSWQLGYRRVTCATNERTAVLGIIPYCGAGHTFTLIRDIGPENASLVVAAASSFPFDYACRQKVSGADLTITVFEQLPMVRPKDVGDQWSEFIRTRVLELTYTAWDLEPFASDCGWPGPPFRWDEERRFLLRCELDAAFFHLYLGSEAEWRQQPEALTRAFPTPRHAVSYIMDTFPIVKRKDEAKHGCYRTKDTILQIYDALAESMASGHPYQTLLNPPPAHPDCCHPPKS